MLPQCPAEPPEEDNEVHKNRPQRRNEEETEEREEIDPLTQHEHVDRIADRQQERGGVSDERGREEKGHRRETEREDERGDHRGEEQGCGVVGQYRSDERTDREEGNIQFETRPACPDRREASEQGEDPSLLSQRGRRHQAEEKQVDVPLVEQSTERSIEGDDAGQKHRERPDHGSVRFREARWPGEDSGERRHEDPESEDELHRPAPPHSARVYHAPGRAGGTDATGTEGLQYSWHDSRVSCGVPGCYTHARQHEERS